MAPSFDLNGHVHRVHRHFRSKRLTGTYWLRNLENSHQRQFVHLTNGTRTYDNLYRIALVPKTTRTQDKSYSRRLEAKTTHTWGKCYPRQLLLVWLPKLKQTKDYSRVVLTIIYKTHFSWRVLSEGETNRSHQARAIRRGGEQRWDDSYPLC